MQTEGVGGPCPRCGGMNCYIKKGSAGWYSAIACSDCLFAYGEDADSMLAKTKGVVTGVDVWYDFIKVLKPYSMENLRNILGGNNELSVETPFRPDSFTEEEMNLCIISESMLKAIIDTVQKVHTTDETD
jgi:hypothetical protein